MAGNKFIAEQLVKTSGFQDVDPTLLASGEIGIYYCNSEKVVGDGGFFKEFGENAQGMWHHSVGMMDKNPDFRKIIEILAEEAKRLLPKEGMRTISGGQTRDWLFSAPVARMLKLPHIAIYKPVAGKPDRFEMQDYDGSPLNPNISLGSHTADLHIVDLITEGSSCYHKEPDGSETGWIPMLRRKGVKISDLMAVVTRYQGGEENLAEVGVTVHPMVGIDEEFLKAHSKNSEAVSYFRDPEKWSKNFLRKNGGKMFARFFDPSNTEKQTRAKRFIERYGDALRAANKFNALNKCVDDHYGLSIDQIMKGETLYKTTLLQKWKEAVARKNSILCAGLDPADYWQASENTLPEGADKFEWCLDFIDKVGPYSAAVKINRNFIKGLTTEQVESLTKKIEKHGMLPLDDSKLPDIGNTNDHGLYATQHEGFAGVTYSPFPGNFEEVAIMAHNRGVGLIGMCIMSNPQHFAEKNKLVDITDNLEGYHIEDIVEMEHPKLGHRKYVPQFIQLAHDAAKYKWDGVVIGAPSPGNHVTVQEVERVKAYIGDNTLVLMPGVGAQGGDADAIIKMFGDNVIVNVGRAVLYAKDPAKAAMQYRDMLNSIRQKYRRDN